MRRPGTPVIPSLAVLYYSRQSSDASELSLGRWKHKPTVGHAGDGKKWAVKPWKDSREPCTHIIKGKKLV